MPTNTSIIDLSELPVPDAVAVPDSAALFQEWLTKLKEADAIYDALLASDPAWKQGEVVAYHTTLLYQKVNDAVRAVLLASATEADLDQLGANFNVSRLMITPAQPDAVPPVEAVYEDDTAFRERIQLSWSQLNTAGAYNAYRFHAKSADADVLDVEAYGPETHGRPGEVDVYVLSRTGDGTASAELLAKVLAAVNPDDKRPLSDFVQVYSATQSTYVVEAELDIPSGPDASTILENAITTLEKYQTELRSIGALMPLSGIYHALHQSGVVRVNLIHPTVDIIAAVGAAPYCTENKITKRDVEDAI
ncbi:baseplate assembly protein [Cedecea davisae]|uniref:baseplate assembly protein n=1 Tax=Cedecea davisae TaxID=158484 RepID=UPI001D09A9EB|nr:baseplate J/gp47 family protein [Cedecea davisae]